MKKEFKRILIFLTFVIILLLTTNEETKIYGDDDNDCVYKWTKVLENVKYVTTTGRSSYAIKEDGSLWVAGACWPEDDFWLKKLDKVKYVCASEGDDSPDEDYVLALKEDGTLWASGYNEDGQLGTGNNEDLWKKFVKV